MGEDLDLSPAPCHAPSAVTASRPRISVHQRLGGSTVADVLLWKRRSLGIFVLVCVTSFWLLFGQAGYSFLSLVANVILLLVAILFFWAKSATLLNRPLPPLPNLEVSEHSIERFIAVAAEWINHVLAIAHEIAIERNVKRFVEVLAALWLVSFIGSLFSFLTLVYIGCILAFTVPVFYDKYQVLVDEKLLLAHSLLLPYWRKIDDTVLSKIPFSPVKQKKTD